jgi:hypothetical protein
MLLAAGELTNKSPLGAYVIKRGACTSAYTLTVKPAGTLGISPSGFETVCDSFGIPVPGGGSLSACGCGSTEVC